MNNTGLMWEGAAETGALLIWAEHRYFGESFPPMEGVRNCIAYLSSQEALADYAWLVETLRMGGLPWTAPTSPVIAFGGSYGGMLAAWFRMKYPSQVDGAIAASAPIWGFPYTQPAIDGSAAQLSNAAKVIGGAPANCASNLKSAYVILRDAAKTAEGRAAISSSMGLCDAMESEEDAVALLAYLQGPLFNLAEGSYPFPSDYITYATFNGSLAQLPPWPMRELCKPIADDFGVSLAGDESQVVFTVAMGDADNEVSVSVDWDQSSNNGYSVEALQGSRALDLLAALAEGSQVWYNVTGTKQCVDWKGVAPPSRATRGQSAVAAAVKLQGAQSGDHDRDLSEVCTQGKKAFTTDLAWGALCCVEGINLVNTAAHGLGRDVYWPPNQPRNVTMEQVVTGSMAYCAQYEQLGFYGAPKRPDEWGKWLTAAYGGKRIESSSNIFFSNGGLDPWAAAGVPAPGPTGSLPAALITMGGHHLDLFFPTPDDPPCVVEVRATEMLQIQSWIGQAQRHRAAVSMPNELVV